jgi:hypothetical protein
MIMERPGWRPAALRLRLRTAVCPARGWFGCIIRTTCGSSIGIGVLFRCCPARLAALLQNHAAKGETAVLACSALKKAYRDRLRVSDQVKFIYLHGDFDLIWQRMQQRANHYMKADMLHSQFATLEAPTIQEAWTINVTLPMGEILNQILGHLPVD